MSYQVNFKGPDLPAITVSNERGIKLKDLWFDGKKDLPVDIDGNAYLIGSIKSIVAVADPVERIPDFSQSVLGEGKQCTGQHSIQKEINDIAKEVGGRQGPDNPQGLKWSKLITSKKWREEMRQKLRGRAADWCDHRAGECACA